MVYLVPTSDETEELLYRKSWPSKDGVAKEIFNLLKNFLIHIASTLLWPLSRQAYLKQFLSLNGDSTMLQQTVSRLSGLTNENLPVVCNKEDRFIVAE